MSGFKKIPISQTKNNDWEIPINKINEEQMNHLWNSEDYEEWNTIIEYVIYWIVILLIVFCLVWLFPWNKKVSQIEQIRKEIIETNSWTLAELNKEIAILQKQLDNKKLIKENLEICLNANSYTGVVIDCNQATNDIKLIISNYE
jgi:penicillin-binding protein-related factor A (putative recombinase)